MLKHFFSRLYYWIGHFNLTGLGRFFRIKLVWSRIICTSDSIARSQPAQMLLRSRIHSAKVTVIKHCCLTIMKTINWGMGRLQIHVHNILQIIGDVLLYSLNKTIFSYTDHFLPFYCIKPAS